MKMARKRAKMSRTAEDKLILALDIGTRSIVGIVLEEAKPFKVRAVEYLEHETRPMYDGQIHDVETVAQEIKIVKERLEKTTGLVLKTAAVAAAGRALKTARGEAVVYLPPFKEIEWEQVKALELQAVQDAQLKSLGPGGDSGGYFCVGYSVINYYLEDQVIQNLRGQSGSKAKAEVIATFLPRVVVDGLLSAVRRAGLDIASLTLEPIAAMAAAIPETMRLLNLALVDVGAGTSDIAIVRQGSVVSYAMVPMGGDEVTECIAQKYLLDFTVAEEIKRRLNEQEEVTFLDILGNEMTLSSKEIIQEINPVVKEIASLIAYEILSHNQKRPDAVVCVGGGSLTPGLLSEIAQILELPPTRVGLRTREMLKNVEGDFPELSGPKAVTPIGIALLGVQAANLPLIKVTVNERELPLWGLNQVTVSSALLASGLALSNVYGRPGMGITVEVNGAVKIFKGTVGTPPTIRVNGEPAGLDTPLKDGDCVEFIRGTDGQDAKVLVRDLLEEEWGEVVCEGRVLRIAPEVMVNGEPRGLEDEVPDRAVVSIRRGRRLSEILSMAGFNPSELQPRAIPYCLNGKQEEVLWCPYLVRVNEQTVEGDPWIYFGSTIELEYRGEFPTLRQALARDERGREMEVKVNGKPLKLMATQISITINGQEVSWDEPLLPEADIRLGESRMTAIVSDVLNHVEITPARNKRLLILVNGEPAGFTTPIKDGDEIEFIWK